MSCVALNIYCSVTVPLGHVMNYLKGHHYSHVHDYKTYKMLNKYLQKVQKGAKFVTGVVNFQKVLTNAIIGTNMYALVNMFQLRF